MSFIDYQALHSLMKFDKYPIPKFAEVLAIVKGSKIFRKLDMFTGF